MYLVSYSDSFDDAVGVCCDGVDSFKKALYTTEMKESLYLGDSAIITTPLKNLCIKDCDEGVKSVKFYFRFYLLDTYLEEREVFLIPLRCL